MAGVSFAPRCRDATGPCIHPAMTDAAFSFRKIAVPAYGPSLLYGVSNGAILPVVALSARELGASLAMSGLIAALIGVGSLLSNIPAALLTDRFGERRAIAGAALLSVVALLLAIAAPNVAVLAVSMLIIGMASSVFILARQTYLVEVVPLNLRARALSTLGGTTRIGVFAGPFAGAALIHLMGLSGAYWAAAAAMLVAGLIAILAPDLQAQNSSAGAGPAPNVRQVMRSHARVFLTLGVGILLVSALRASRQVVIPLWAEQLGIDATTTSLIYGMVAAIDMSVFYPAGKIMDQHGRVWVAMPCTLLMGFALMGIPFTGGAVAFVLFSLILGFGNGIGSGIVMTLGADASPPSGRVQFLGVWRLMSDLGSCGGPVLLSAVTAVAGLASAVFSIGVLGWVAAAIFWRWLPRQGKPKVG